MIRILHTGDIHLGDLNGPTKDGHNLRRLDTLRCMEAVVGGARRYWPHISIVAGDLFNRSRVWADTALEDVNDALERFLRPLCDYSEHVVLLFGTENHDNPRAFELLRQSTTDLRNLHICTTPQVERIHTAEGYVQILAIPGFDKGRLRLFCPGADKETENRNATALINDVALGLATQLDRDLPAVMVAHYTVAGAEADNGSTFLAGQDVVISPATIDATGVDLACFGHIHRPQRLTSNTPAYYCGSVNQLNFNDEGTAHGFYFHDLDPQTRQIASGFVRTPEREHYTYRMSADDVAVFIQNGTVQAPHVTDKIVRVRYICSAEQEKAFNRAELQKKLMQAGAFYVSEVLPEEVEELDAKDDMTEHDGPAETLVRWLDMNEVPEDTQQRLMELAAPIIKTADDGRDTDKHTGAFVPLTIEVKNYRSYTEASIDFDPVHMAMVNGQNGVGKSSLFMDAIADCLYEQTRKEDIGGWVRDGTKSGAITFTFGMGDQKYRVVRTRTKSGRGTLALQRFNPESAAWEDESDSTMRLTQTKIERLLGMDCNTFCSIALIRQDAYGIFLEADSDRRMEVLSALLGLDIYTRMEELAKAGASEQRRKIAATKDRIAILGETISAKADLLAEDAQTVETIGNIKIAITAEDEAITAQEKTEAMRQELEEQARRKNASALEHIQQRQAKLGRLADVKMEHERAAATAGKLESAQMAASTVKKARARLDDLRPDIEKASAMRVKLENARKAASDGAQRILSLKAGKDRAAAVLAQRAEIEAAVATVASLQPKQEDAQRRYDALGEAYRALSEARQARHLYLSDSKNRISALETAIANAEKEAARLDDSNCPVGDSAPCSFMASAVRARRDLIPTLTSELAALKEKCRAEYASLQTKEDAAQAIYDALGDPRAEIDEIGRQVIDLAPLVNLAPQLKAAEEQMAAIDADLAQAETAKTHAEIEAMELESDLEALATLCAEAETLRQTISSKQAVADTLPACEAAAATVKALVPQIEQLFEEIEALGASAEKETEEVAEIRARIPEASGSLTEHKIQRDALQARMDALMTKRGEIKARLASVTDAEAQTAELRKAVEASAVTLNDYVTLARAFGLDGIQYMIIRGVVPEIMRQSNDILAAMTGGRMAVDIRTEKEQRSTKQIVNSLEVWISSIQGSVRPYLSHSGGEKVKIALAVTLGLADVKARRAGVQLGMLFIDEPPFLDADGTEAYADALTNMSARNPGMRILAISHDPTMKARFSQNITVSAGENGSTVSMD